MLCRYKGFNKDPPLHPRGVLRALPAPCQVDTHNIPWAGASIAPLIFLKMVSRVRASAVRCFSYLRLSPPINQTRGSTRVSQKHTISTKACSIHVDASSENPLNIRDNVSFTSFTLAATPQVGFHHLLHFVPLATHASF